MIVFHQLQRYNLKYFIVGLLILCGINSTQAKTYFASFTGNGNGTSGTLNNPFELQSALFNTSKMINPGDTLFILEGTYNKAYVFELEGTQTAPIIISAYPGDHVIIDGNLLGEAVIKHPFVNCIVHITGSHLIISNLEILNSFKENWEGRNNPEPASKKNENFINNTGGIFINGASVTIKNCCIHDCPHGGFFAYKKAIDYKLISCQIFNNGHKAFSRFTGEGVYTQSSEQSNDHRIVANNIVAQNASFGMKLYGTDASFLKNFNITGNIYFNNGMWGTTEKYFNVLLGGGNTLENINFSGNILYRPYFVELDRYYGNFSLGYSREQNVINCNLNQNIFHGGFSINNPKETKFIKNEIFLFSKDSKRPNIECEISNAMSYNLEMSPSDLDFSENKIYNPSEEFINFRYKIPSGHLAGQKLSLIKNQLVFTENREALRDKFFKFERNSVTSWDFRTQKNRIIIKKDSLMLGRAYITVFNWEKLNSVSINYISFLGLGTPFIVRNSLNSPFDKLLDKSYDKKPIALKSNFNPTLLPLSAKNVPPQFSKYTTEQYMSNNYCMVYILDYFPFNITYKITKKGNKNFAVFSGANGLHVFELLQSTTQKYTTQTTGNVLEVSKGIQKVKCIAENGVSKTIQIQVK